MFIEVNGTLGMYIKLCSVHKSLMPNRKYATILDFSFLCEHLLNAIEKMTARITECPFKCVHFLFYICSVYWKILPFQLFQTMMWSREISLNSNIQHFQFSIWLKCSFGEEYFAGNASWIGPMVPKLWAIEIFSKQ